MSKVARPSAAASSAFDEAFRAKQRATQLAHGDDQDEWQAALARARANEAPELAAARERALAAAEEEEWAWREALARAKAQADAEEAREWSMHLARARSLPASGSEPKRIASRPGRVAAPERASRPQRRLVFWP